jgi:hypothetical protein
MALSASCPLTPQVVEACNREVGRMKMMEEIVHIANKTEFECKVKQNAKYNFDFQLSG